MQHRGSSPARGEDTCALTAAMALNVAQCVLHAAPCPQLQSSQAEVAALAAENTRMFPELDKMMADNKALQAEVRGATRWQGWHWEYGWSLLSPHRDAAYAAGAEAASLAFHTRTVEHVKPSCAERAAGNSALLRLLTRCRQVPGARACDTSVLLGTPCLLQVQRLAAQVVAAGEEQAKLRGALSAARDQVAQLQSNPPILVRVWG